jgi:hypothetical protein
MEDDPNILVYGRQPQMNPIKCAVHCEPHMLRNCEHFSILKHALTHYLAYMGREVPKIKMPLVPRWVLELDPKWYTVLESLLTGVHFPK